MKQTLLRISYQYCLKPLLFRIDPERVHDRFLGLGEWLSKRSWTKAIVRWLFAYQNPQLEQKIAGLTFPNPIGLSAGFDKDGRLVNLLQDIGFGFAQIGTMTFGAYAGNPKPRLVRLPKSKGLIVNYGLKNEGVGVILPRVAAAKAQIPIGLSVGYTNSPQMKDPAIATADFIQGFEAAITSSTGDLYVINISCPNLFGGEPFTTPDKLRQLLDSLCKKKMSKPVFLKMPINLVWSEFAQLLDVAAEYPSITGVIIGNLNKDREDPTVVEPIEDSICGSISGRPTAKRSDERIAKTYQAHGDRFVIIGCGGIFSAQDAYAKIKKGASLVQLITGMIYQGPQLIGQMNKELVELLSQDGFSNICEAIGSDHRRW